VQAAQLPDEQVEAELARSRRAQQVLPLVRPAHAAPGDEVVARQTREERRKRRELQGAPAASRRREVARPSSVTEAPAAPAHTPARSGNPVVRFFHFVGESYAELRKVEWPRQQQVIQGTVVVLVACILVGFYLWGADQVFKRLVENVLLR